MTDASDTRPEPAAESDDTATAETAESAPVARADDTAGPDASRMTIVGVGASAGGLEALERFFQKIPAEPGVAFVVIQHLSPDFKSLMGEVLGRRTAGELDALRAAIDRHFAEASR